MKGYTKLHAKIVHSSIWQAPLHVRIVWITMLALADQDGVVEGSVAGLANVSGVTKAQCREALKLLVEPDEDSSDGGTGERIEVVPGGWFVINHRNYRDKQTIQQAQTAERVRRYRAKQDEAALPVTPVTVSSGRKRPPAYASASASAPLKYSEGFEVWWRAYPRRVGKGAAFTSWKKVVGTAEIFQTIMVATTALAKVVKDPKFVPNPATWLNQRRWEDDQEHCAAAGRGVKQTGAEMIKTADHSGSMEINWDDLTK